MGFTNGKVSLYTIMALMNSNVGVSFSKIFCGTTDYKPGQLTNFPLLDGTQQFDDYVKENIAISKDDWDEFEVSWDFRKLPIVRGKSLKATVNELVIKNTDRRNRTKKNEEYINENLVKLYGLENEIEWHVNDDDITLKAISNDLLIKNLVSYLIGIEMGRYSLDVEGLVYAGGEWNPINYVTYQPDDDGIIPVYPQLGMADGLTARIIKLIKHIYGEDTYKENIDFIADALGKKSSESSEETLNRYLNEGFYETI